MKKLFLSALAVFSMISLQAQEFAAVQFVEATDYISTTWNPSFGDSADFSIDFAIRSEGWSSDPAILSDKDWASGGNKGFNIALAGDGQGIDVNVGDGSNRADLQAGNIADGEWHNVLVSFDRDGNVSLYIDGALAQATSMANVGNIDSEFNFNIGQDGTGNYGQAASCSITNVRVWNRVVTASETSDIVCDQITEAHPTFANLIHYYFLQEGTGTEVADLGGNNGTLNGNASWVVGELPTAVLGFNTTIDASTVIFENQTEGAGSFFWDFGNGITSTSTNPTQTYFALGTYTVKLVARNICGADSITQEVTITELNENLVTTVNLDGADDLVEFENVAFGASDFTIELRVRSEGWSSDPSIIANKNWGSGSNPGFIIAGKGDGTTWKLNIGDGSSRMDLDGGVINDNQWHHIAASVDRDGNTFLYQDGEKVAEGATPAFGNLDNDLKLAVGQDGTLNYSAFFKGQVSEVRIWTTALDSATLADNLCEATEEHPNYANLLHYWKMDEGTGVTAQDSRGSNNGVFNGEWVTTLNNFTECGGSNADANFTAAKFATTSAADYIATEWNPTFGTDQDFSIDFRVRSEGWSSDPSIISDKDWGSGGNKGFNVALGGNGTGIDVNVGDGENRTDLLAGIINDGEWHHVLVSFDRDGEVSMYIDGLFAQSASMANVGDIDSEFTFKLGQDGTGTYGQAATAEMAEVRVWNRLVEVGELDICTSLSLDNPIAEDLLHYWKLDEGVGETAADSKGDNDGTWVGTSAWTNFNNFPPAIAAFDHVTALSTVNFINLSTSGTYKWDFGDGSTSTASDPVHTYLNTGSFDVTLIVLSACNTDTITQTVQIDLLSTNLLNSINLDGTDDYVVFDENVNFGTDQDFTIEMFVRSEGWNSDPSILSNKDWGSGGNPGFIIAAQGNGLTWKFNIGDGNSRIDMNGGTINDGKWHHIAVSFDRDGAKRLYHDGELLDQNFDDFTGNVDSDLDLAIGQDGTLSYGANFAGQVAEVRIWGAALDSATIVANFCGAEESHPNFADLLHYWKLDEGQDTVINDTKGANQGVYNGEWIVSLNDLEGCEGPVPSNTLGAGNAVEFDAINDWIDASGNDGQKVSAESLGLPTREITLECWVKPRTYDIWHSMVAFMQDNGSFERGFDLETRPANKFAFALSTEVGGDEDGTLTYMETTNSFEENTWYHVAGVYDGETMEIYVNGILENSNDSRGGDIRYADSWLALGMYKDDNEDFSLDGAIDEVRIWNKARTVEEIRMDMSRKLNGDEDDLVAYYQFSNLVGEEIVDNGPNGLNGQMQNMVAAQARIISGAAVGDISEQAYGDLEGTSLSIGFSQDATGSQFAIYNFKDAEGVQVYRVNAAPNSTEGINAFPGDSSYYGVYPIGKNAKYTVEYLYSGFPDAVAAGSDLILASRNDAAEELWVNIGATVNTGSTEITKSDISNRKEFLLGTASATNCSFPSEVSLQDSTFSTLDISWNSTQSLSSIEFGPAGFSLGNGTIIDSVTANVVIEELLAQQSYDVYLRDICADGSYGDWVGPFNFSTETCLLPADLGVDSIGVNGARLTWTESVNATSYNMEWGPAGFDLGVGIAVEDIAPDYLLEGLFADFSVDYYVQAVCGDAGSSPFVGPFNFTTVTVGIDASVAGLNEIKLYPNPANEIVNVAISSDKFQKVNLELINILGETVQQRSLQVSGSNEEQLNVSELARGIYFLRISTDKGSVTQRFLKK